MAIGADLRQALRTFAAQEKEIVELGKRVEPANAMDFVRMRRRLVMGFADLNVALDKDPWLSGRPELLQQGRSHFSAFRAANSINQANWPVVMARDDPQGYAGASKPVGEKSRAFWAWVEKELEFKR